MRPSTWQPSISASVPSFRVTGELPEVLPFCDTAHSDRLLLGLDRHWRA